ncbi:NAD-dependent epimerase/dehydratase family protein [Pseudomonas viridiflava]|uniref:NAD-dependent epimerase/dehydratase family protein n=1 Tax=Pseudomonas viridiflava TaxID=33069 RepID=UPI000F05D512|nr:NAD-dependent epimerase/dehydratase family protein [Pseudomonas viridiflava]
MKILVTGATGFIGKALLHRLATESEYQVTGSTRQENPEPSMASLIQVGTANAATDWSAALQDVDAVIHVAAHLATPGSSLKELRSTNVDGTLALARQALSAGTRRFIFISSVGVNGSTTHHAAFNEISLPAPADDYAQSKLEAEQALQKLLKGTEMEWVIIRPPLVYAGHAPRNFSRLMQWVSSGVPMPFAAIHNRRSMIALDNLVDFIALCIKHPAAANELFLISDGTDMSTAQLVTHLANGMGSSARLVPVPKSLLRHGARLLGKGPMYSTLCASLAVDSDKARRVLGWTPPLATIDALIQSGRDYRRLNT